MEPPVSVLQCLALYASATCYQLDSGTPYLRQAHYATNGTISQIPEGFIMQKGYDHIWVESN